MIWLWRLSLVVVWIVAIGAPRALADCIDAPDLAAYQTLAPEDFAVGSTRLDRIGRVIAPISVNGRGPYRFIVDTGANRSVLSQALADELGLAPSGVGDVHTVHGVTSAPITNVNSLHYAGLSLGNVAMPVMQGPMLAGEHGLLGVDGMRGRRLRMDFERNCIEIIPAARAPRLRNWLRIPGELRFGHLVVVRGSINGVSTHMLIDTGSNVSLANVALREALGARFRRDAAEGSMVYTAGDPIFLQDSIFMPRVELDDLEVRNVRAYVGDFHIFQIWELLDEPTLLVGMDVLSRSRGLAIDYSNGDVYFRIQESRPRIQFVR